MPLADAAYFGDTLTEVQALLVGEDGQPRAAFWVKQPREPFGLQSLPYFTVSPGPQDVEAIQQTAAGDVPQMDLTARFYITRWESDRRDVATDGDRQVMVMLRSLQHACLWLMQEMDCTLEQIGPIEDGPEPGIVLQIARLSRVIHVP